MKHVAALLLACLVGFTFMHPAAAQVADSDRAAMRAVIDGQMAAFGKDDGGAAYGYASPGIHAIFPTVDAFMNMVRGAYPQVYRPESFVYGPALDTPRGPVQRVFITGPDGAGYVAEYLFERQPDGTWKINGVTIVKDDAPTI